MADTSLPVSGNQGTAPVQSATQNLGTTPIPRFNTIDAALRAILAEVAPGNRPYSGDSYLPAHLVEAAQAALDGIDLEVNQRAHNALATAGWHIARGEPDKALARLRRAQAHILHSMTIGRA